MLAIIIVAIILIDLFAIAFVGNAGKNDNPHLIDYDENSYM